MVLRYPCLDTAIRRWCWSDYWWRVRFLEGAALTIREGLSQWRRTHRDHPSIPVQVPSTHGYQFLLSIIPPVCAQLPAHYGIFAPRSYLWSGFNSIWSRSGLQSMENVEQMYISHCRPTAAPLHKYLHYQCHWQQKQTSIFADSILQWWIQRNRQIFYE